MNKLLKEHPFLLSIFWIPFGCMCVWVRKQKSHAPKRALHLCRCSNLCVIKYAYQLLAVAAAATDAATKTQLTPINFLTKFVRSLQLQQEYAETMVTRYFCSYTKITGECSYDGEKVHIRTTICKFESRPKKHTNGVKLRFSHRMLCISLDLICVDGIFHHLSISISISFFDFAAAGWRMANKIVLLRISELCCGQLAPIELFRCSALESLEISIKSFIEFEPFL